MRTVRSKEPDSRRRAADHLLWTTSRRGGSWLVVLTISALVLAAVDVALPAVIGRALDAALGRASRAWVLGAAGLAVLMVVADAADDLASGSATARSTASLRRSLTRHLLLLGMRVEGRFAAGDLTARLGGNAADVGKLAPRVIRSAAGALSAAGSTVALALIDPWLCVTFLVAVPPLVLLFRVLAREATDAGARYLETQGELSGRLVDALAGSRTIAAAGTQGREVQRVLGPLPELHRRGVRMWQTQARMATQGALLIPLLELAVLAVGGLELTRGRITPGELLAAAQYVAMAASFGGLTGMLTQLAHSRAAAGRVAEVLGEPPIAYGTEEPPQGDGTLELRGVGVEIGGRPVLSDVDLVVPGGSLVAVVGPSGAGKTVLAAVAGRLIDPDRGEVLLDGTALRRLSRDGLRRAVAFGFERPVLFGGTMSDAIAFGAQEPAPAEVVAGARAAQAHDFIERLPKGYGTAVADAPMSGGERQRVGLARAFVHAKRLLVLDDVVASLDTLTERSIVGVLTGELRDRTRILVAHRASTAARADTVVWLEGGRVRAVAPHRELWYDAGYRALFSPEEPAAVTDPNRSSNPGPDPGPARGAEGER